MSVSVPARAQLASQDRTDTPELGACYSGSGENTNKKLVINGLITTNE